MPKYEGSFDDGLPSYHFRDSDRLRVGSVTRLNRFEWLAVMVIGQPGTAAIIIGASPTLPRFAHECFQRHLMFYTCNYNIRVTLRNGAIKYLLLIRSTEDHQQMFFIHFVAPCACSSSSG